jgi:beta-galactosidase
MDKTMFRFGADYYPEHWPEERWPEDARLMAEAGFNVVRMAEFAWSKMEPSEGQFDFTWLDRALEILHSRGISAVLGTPTASPPPWLMAKDEALFNVRQDGRRTTYGNRCEYCPSHPLYHEHTRRIVTAMAEHYAGHPAVIGWQIDNEFGSRCYCPVCQVKFQEWLKVRYGTLEKMNAAWGTNFWSHVYTDWTQIPIPVATGGSPNPGLALDYDRFMSDTYVTYQKLQVDLLSQKCGGQFITHNFMGFGYEGINYYDLAAGLDLVTWDNYPSGFWSKESVNPSGPALGHDTMRCLKKQNFWVMEQQAGPSGWEIVGPSPRPGELRLWAYQSIAHGADGIVFFRWRTARHGTEQYWHGLLEHNARTGRRYEEIKQMGLELKKVGDQIAGAQVNAQVAIVQSYDTRWAFQVQANHPDFRYGEHVQHIYEALNQQNISVDVVSPADDLTAYKLVVLPAMYVLPEGLAANLKKFVEAGGTLVVTPRTGVKDEANAVVNLPLPGLLTNLCGVTVEEYDSLWPGVAQSVEFSSPGLAGTKVAARLWCDVLAPNGAQVIAKYGQDYYAGKPAITRNLVGKGQAVYVGTFGGADLYHALFGWLLSQTGIVGAMKSPAGVEVTERKQGDKRLLFILNHTAESQTVDIPAGYNNLMDGKPVNESVIVAARDVLILVSG